MKNLILFLLLMTVFTSQIQAQGCDVDDPNDTIAPPKVKIFG